MLLKCTSNSGSHAENKKDTRFTSVKGKWDVRSKKGNYAVRLHRLGEVAAVEDGIEKPPC